MRHPSPNDTSVLNIIRPFCVTVGPKFSLIKIRPFYAPFFRASIHYAIFRATVCSNRWREPIGNAHPLNSAFNWFSLTVAANSCTKSCVRVYRCIYETFFCAFQGAIKNSWCRKDQTNVSSDRDIATVHKVKFLYLNYYKSFHYKKVFILKLL